MAPHDRGKGDQRADDRAQQYRQAPVARLRGGCAAARRAAISAAWRWAENATTL